MLFSWDRQIQFPGFSPNLILAPTQEGGDLRYRLAEDEAIFQGEDIRLRPRLVLVDVRFHAPINEPILAPFPGTAKAPARSRSKRRSYDSEIVAFWRRLGGPTERRIEEAGEASEGEKGEHPPRQDEVVDQETLVAGVSWLPGT